ncbi:DNA cytosine methyltransferase [Azospirillum doebereinerae]|uniref:DNA (cytosine-5-)-methyltransferase n=1 Tax=Azospirillum doebereinerae TaxID=92933 RepID=A0A3S0VDS0_9PROT|nr:DNA cytosine methyltransferase [Azospirillum doebereinerae]RUQ61243.1 DNA cytosine methyltransferase [Azospirillum doebereinerae]
MDSLFPSEALRPVTDAPRHRRRVHQPPRQSPNQWPLDDSINVVLFAGLGGACQGLEEAGCPVHVANNHDDIAIAAHAALNPHTKHIRGDIFDVDPIQATGGRRVKVLWASPDCRDHSVAKGGAPRSARVRSLPWQVCRWIGKTRPQVVMVENVREIRGWGPLVAKRDKATGRVLKLDGAVAAKGERVPRDQQQLVRDKMRLGRSFRRFVSHLKRLGGAYDDRDLNCADYGVPTSRRRYFAVIRFDGGVIRWPARTHAPRDEATALGLLPWVPAADIIDWSLPLPSIFERKKPLADATMKRIATGLKRFVLDNPTPFIIPLTHHGEGRVYPVAETLRTVTSAHRGELAVVAPTVVRPGHTGPGYTAHRGQDVAVPLQTITGSPEFGVVGATMVQTGYGEREGQAPRALDLQAPIGTQVAGGGKHAVVGAMMAPAIMCNNENNVGVAPTEPVPTLTTANRNYVTGAWMAQHNTGVVGHEMTDALSTMTTAGTQQQLAAAYLTKFRGTCAHGQTVETPAPSICANGGHTGCVAAFLTKYYGAEADGQDCRDALHTLSTRDRFGVVTVTIDGQPYAVTDIGMRMLEPHEAAAAHELALPKLITVAGKTRPLTKTESMRLVGNSVPKRMARLLAQANAVHALHPSLQAAE